MKKNRKRGNEKGKMRERQKHNERIVKKEKQKEKRTERVKLEERQLHEECNSRMSKNTLHLNLHSSFILNVNKY